MIRSRRPQLRKTTHCKGKTSLLYNVNLEVCIDNTRILLHLIRFHHSRRHLPRSEIRIPVKIKVLISTWGKQNIIISGTQSLQEVNQHTFYIIRRLLNICLSNTVYVSLFMSVSVCCRQYYIVDITNEDNVYTSAL